MPVVVLTKRTDEPRIKQPNALKIAEGHKWNPMLKYPRNESCYCNSGLKAKKCCLLLQPLAINQEFAEKAAPYVKTLRSSK